MPIRTMNFQSRGPLAKDPTSMINNAGRTLSKGFNALDKLGLAMSENRKQNNIANTVSQIEGNSPEEYQANLMRGLLNTPGVNVTEATTYTKALLQPRINERKYQRDLFTQDRTHNLSVDKFGETKRHNRAGEVKYWEGEDGAQYSYDPNYIAEIESGGSYTAKNPNSSAYGKYQHLEATTEALAQRLGMTPEQLMSTPQGQEMAQQELQNEQVAQLGQMGLPVNNDNMLALHQMGYPTFKKYIEGTLSEEDKDKVSHLKSYQNGLPKGVRRLSPGDVSKDDSAMISDMKTLGYPITKEGFSAYQTAKRKAEVVKTATPANETTINNSNTNIGKKFDDMAYKQFGEDGYNGMLKLPLKVREGMLKRFKSNGMIGSTFVEGSFLGDDAHFLLPDGSKLGLDGKVIVDKK